MSFKQTIEQLARQQNMTVEFLNLTKDLWLDLFAEWTAENMSEGLANWVTGDACFKSMLLLFLPRIEADYNRLALELESEGVAFYDHLSDKEPRQCAG